MYLPRFPDRLKTSIPMHVRRHLLRLILRSVEMFLLLMPRSFEVFSPACGCPFLLWVPVPPFSQVEVLSRSIEVFSPCSRGGTFLLITKWNLLLIKSANFRVHFGIQSPSTSTVRNFCFSPVRFKKFE